MSAYLDVTLFLTTFLTLFVIMDPPGIIPVFLALTSTQTAKQRRAAAAQATLTSFGVMLVFTLFGRSILDFLQISLPALEVSGGLLLLLVAMELLTGKGEGSGATKTKNNVALVPLATPLMAGPGSIVAIMVAAQNSSGSIAAWSSLGAALLAVHVALWLAMRFADVIHSILGEDGTLLITRLAGMLLAAIAVQIMANGVFSFIDAYLGST
ncbi:MAG: MarC family protein [Bowdeniella nasicola]|nr:MarC family protein [Bowdeniella nasicola]